MTNKKRQHSFFQFFNSVFFTLSAAILIVIILCGVIFFRLYTSVENVVEKTVPSFNRISSVNSNTLILSTVALRIAETHSASEFADLSKQINASFEFMRAEIQYIISTEHTVDKLNGDIRILNDYKNTLLELANANIKQSQLLEARANELLTTLARASGQSKLLYIEAEKELFRDSKNEDIHSLISKSQFITNISHDLELITIMVLNAKRESDPDRVEQIQEDFNTAFRNIVFTLSNLDSENAQGINQAINSIYMQALKADNYFELAKDVKSTRQQLNATAEAMSASIASILDFMGPLFEATTLQDQKTLSGLLKDSQFYFIGLLILALFTLALVAVLNRTIVPRRIISPLKQMATDIIELSKNNARDLTFTHDSVELAEVKDALIIFRENATQLLHREEELVVKNRELTELNENLKTFLRVSSHDLRTPLRGIDLLVSIIEEDLATQNETGIVKNLERVKIRTRRMDNLLASLADYMRTDKAEIKLKKVNVEELVLEQFKLLNIAGTFTIELHIDVQYLKIDEVPFKTVIRNLLDNAIKHHDKVEGEIQFHLHQSKNKIEVSVSDDGPGIPERFQNRVFKPFETLQPKDQVEGSGMGLAILRKIVESHQGEIMVQSPISHERGCRFTFTWENGQ